MSSSIPDLSQFRLEELGETPRVENPNAEISLKVDVEPPRVTSRVLVGILDERRRCGMTVAVYPATGEVCDVSNGGGVVGYLSKSPLSPGVPLPCDLTLYRFGKNFVCSARIQGELFLYPAFCLVGDAKLTAFVGQENDGGETGLLSWSRLRLDVLEQPVAA